MVRLRVLAASPTANMAIKLLFFLKTAKRMRRFHETDGRCACPPERQRRRRFLPRFSQCGRASLRPASPSRGCCFTTFCHQKVAPKVSARHLRRDRTSVLAERARKTALFAAQKEAPFRLWRLGKVRKRPLPSPVAFVRTPAPNVRTAVRSVSACGALRRLRCVSRNDDFSCCYLFWQAVGLRNSAM